MITYLPFEEKDDNGNITEYGVYIIKNGYGIGVEGRGSTPQEAQKDAENKAKKLKDKE